MSPSPVSSIRPFILTAGVSFATLIGSAVTGAVVFGPVPPSKPPPGAIVLGAVLFGSLLVFAYTLVPILLRAFVRSQMLIGNGDTPPLRWLQANERKAWWVVWTLWTLGLALAIPFAIRDWSSGR
jgi:hypothetical protein